MKTHLQWTVVFLILAGFSFTHASTSETAADSIQIKYHFNPVVKTASKIAHAQRDLAASISLIDEADIDVLPTPAVFDAVQSRVPGLYVTQWGVMGFGVAGSAAGKISIRGTGGSANSCVLILRNGRPDFMGLMGCTIADEFSTDGVERIEIIRGPGSFLYGTNAISGIINIIPKQMHHGGFSTRITTGYGNYDSRILALSHGGKLGAFDYYITANTRKTDGHRTDGNSFYEGDHYTFHTGYALSENTMIDMNANLANISLFDPGRSDNPFSNNWYDIRRYGGDFNVIHNSRLGETNLKLHGNFGKHHFFDGWNSKDRTLGLMIYQNMKPWKGQTATIGFDWKRYGGEAVDASADYGTIYLTEYAPYIHMQQLFWQRFILSAGLRAEHHELYGHELLPKAGLVYHPFESTSIRLSMARGFRSPSIRELYFWMPANAELTPDRLWNYELGFSQQIQSKLNLEIVLFQSDGSNLIQFSGPPPKWINSGSYSHTGYECTATLFPVRSFELGATWTQMSLSENAYNAPGKKLTAYIQYQLGPVLLSADMLMVSDWKSAEPMNATVILHEMDDYTVLNLSAGSKILKGLGIQVNLRNVLDAEYESMYGYPMPGRTLLSKLYYEM